MKNLIRLLTLAALATFFALPTFAQTPAAAPTAAPAAANPCDNSAGTPRGDMYAKYYELKGKKDAKGQPDAAAQKEAYGIGKEFLAKYADCKDDYSKAVEKFVTQYGDAVVKSDFGKAWVAKDIPKAFEVGKQILASNPDDLETILALAWGGYSNVIPSGAAAGNAAITADTITYAKRGVELIESGKTITNWAPFKNRENALSYLNYTLGALSLKANNDAEAIARLVKVAQSEGEAKTEPTTYSYLAFVYEKERDRLAKEYTDKYKEESPESRIALANINLVVDRLIDAYARTVAYAVKTDEATKKIKADAMARLSELYKSRHNNSETGVTELLAKVTTTPLLLTTPVTTDPGATTPAPATSGTAADGGTGNGAMTSTAPTPAAPSATTNTTATQPATQSTPAAKPKPKPVTKKP